MMLILTNIKIIVSVSIYNHRLLIFRYEMVNTKTKELRACHPILQGLYDSKK